MTNNVQVRDATCFGSRTENTRPKNATADKIARNLRRRFLILTGCVLLQSTTACVDRAAPPASGYLYFSAGPYLGVLDLSTGGVRPAARLGGLRIGQVSTLDNDELLLSVSKDQRGRMHNRVLRFDPTNNHSSYLLLGKAAQYLPTNGSIVYNTGTQLVAVPRRNVRSPPTIIHMHARNEAVSMLAVSESNILYSLDKEDALIHFVNLETGARQILDRLSEVCDLDGALWIAGRDRLLCKEARPAIGLPRYRWVSQKGLIDSELALPNDSEFRALAYIQEQGAVVLNETRRGWFDNRDQHPVWIYNIDSDAWHRINKNQYLDTTAVYRKLVQQAFPL